MDFSIIMPIYNVEQYLSEAIESVLNQEYRNFELILINDGSTDNSLEIAKLYKEKDNRIVLVDQENKGLSEARNKGISIAKADYIYFMDSDDWISPETLLSVFEILQKKPYDLVCFLAKPFSNEKVFNQGEDSVGKFDKYYKRSYLQNKEYSAGDYYELMFKNNNFMPSACLYVLKASILKLNNLKFEKNIIHEDNPFTASLILNSKSVFFLKKQFYNRRIRTGSIMTTENNYKKVYSYLIISDLFRVLAIDKKEYKDTYNYSIKKFKEAIHLIDNEFSNDKRLKKMLFKLDNKLKLKEYRRLILKLKFPFLFKVYQKVIN